MQQSHSQQLGTLIGYHKINDHQYSKRYKGVQIVEQATIIMVWSRHETAAQTLITENLRNRHKS